MVIAVARELAGFLWAEMTAEHAPQAVTTTFGTVVIVAATTRRRPAAAGPIPDRLIESG